MNGNLIKWATGLLVLIGMVAAGVYAIDARYARAGDMKQQIGTLKEIVLDMKIDSLKQEKRRVTSEQYEIERTKEDRKLTPLEEKRSRQLEEEVKDLDGAIENLRRRVK